MAMTTNQNNDALGIVLDTRAIKAWLKQYAYTATFNSRMAAIVGDWIMHRTGSIYAMSHLVIQGGAYKFDISKVVERFGAEEINERFKHLFEKKLRAAFSYEFFTRGFGSWVGLAQSTKSWRRHIRAATAVEDKGPLWFSGQLMRYCESVTVRTFQFKPGFSGDYFFVDGIEVDVDFPDEESTRAKPYFYRYSSRGSKTLKKKPGDKKQIPYFHSANIRTFRDLAQAHASGTHGHIPRVIWMDQDTFDEWVWVPFLREVESVFRSSRFRKEGEEYIDLSGDEELRQRCLAEVEAIAGRRFGDHVVDMDDVEFMKKLLENTAMLSRLGRIMRSYKRPELGVLNRLLQLCAHQYRHVWGVVQKRYIERGSQ